MADFVLLWHFWNKWLTTVALTGMTWRFTLPINWWTFLFYAGVVRSFVVRHKVKQLYISITIWPRITKFYTDIHTDRVYNSTGYDIINYFLSDVIYVQKRTKMTLPTATGAISRELFRSALSNFRSLSGIIGLTNLSDTTSLAASLGYKTQLTTVQKCEKRVRRV